MSADDPRDDPAFEAVWRRVVERWDDPKAHGAALGYALEREVLAELAGRYRKLAGDPSKAAEAQKRLDAIVANAMQSLMAVKATGPTETAARLRRGITVVAFVVMTFLLWLLARGLLRR